MFRIIVIVGGTDLTKRLPFLLIRSQASEDEDEEEEEETVEEQVDSAHADPENAVHLKEGGKSASRKKKRKDEERKTVPVFLLPLSIHFLSFVIWVGGPWFSLRDKRRRDEEFAEFLLQERYADEFPRRARPTSERNKE